MVEPMTKLTLLFRPAGRDEFIAELQRFGIVHVEQQKVDANTETSRLAARITHLVQDQNFLRARAAELPEPPGVEPYEGDVQDLIRRIDSLRTDIEASETERAQLRRELALSERWGDFDADRIDGLETFGLQMSVHSAPRPIADETEERLTVDEQRSFVPLFEDGTKMFFAIVGPQGTEEVAPLVAEEKLPDRSVSIVRGELERIDRDHTDALGKIDELLPYRYALGQRITELRNELSYKVVRASVHDTSEGNLFFLTGWIPAAETARLEQFLQAEEAVYILESPQRDEEVPVKLRNGRYTRLFEPILGIFSLPSYRELDPTPFFAPFYTIFFGLCVADLGYGLLLLLAGLIGVAVVKRASLRPLLYLGLVLAASVAVFGFFLNDFFGLKITSISNSHSAVARAVAFGDIHSAMLLAITLGFIQIIFAYVLRAINQTRTQGAAGAMKPIGVALMLIGIVIAALNALGRSFSVGPLPFGALAAAIPHARLVGYGLLAVGLVLLLLFNSLEKKIFIRPVLGLWELYELLTTVPGYILSYLRLFALGLSGALLGETTVKLAMMVRGHGVVGIASMVVVLLIGSGVNLAIGLLSAFVHSLRLTFVEFYNSLGFKGGGVKYDPFEFKS